MSSDAFQGIGDSGLLGCMVITGLILGDGTGLGVGLTTAVGLILKLGIGLVLESSSNDPLCLPWLLFSGSLRLLLCSGWASAGEGLLAVGFGEFSVCCVGWDSELGWLEFGSGIGCSGWNWARVSSVCSTYVRVRSQLFSCLDRLEVGEVGE